MGHRSYECCDNERGKESTHIDQDEEKSENEHALENEPETREYLLLRRTLLKPAKEVN